MKKDDYVAIDVRWQNAGWTEAFRLRLTEWLPQEEITIGIEKPRGSRGARPDVSPSFLKSSHKRQALDAAASRDILYLAACHFPDTGRYWSRSVGLFECVQDPVPPSGQTHVLCGRQAMRR